MIAALTGVYACHLLDRSVILLILEPIRREFRLTDSQLGLLAGMAFALGYTIAVLPFGGLADRRSRKLLLTLCMTLWSGLTLLCGLASTFGILILARLGVGAAESGGQPVVMSLVGDITTPENRTRTIGLVHTGIPIGTLLAGALGSLVATKYGWRDALFIAGIPGLLLAVVMTFAFKEPPRVHVASATNEDNALGFYEYLRFLRSRADIVCAIVGLVVAAFVSGGSTAFIVSLLVRIDHLPLGQAALAVALVGAVGAALGNLLSGAIAGRFAGGAPEKLAYFAAVAAVLHILFGLATVLVPDPRLACLFFGMKVAVYYGIYTPGTALVVTLATSRTRGRVIATVSLGATLIGFGLGPTVTGALSDLLAQIYNVQGLRYALALIMPVMGFAAIAFVVAGFHIRRRAARPLRTDLSDSISAR
jgi:MFS family permease